MEIKLHNIIQKTLIDKNKKLLENYSDFDEEIDSKEIDNKNE